MKFIPAGPNVIIGMVLRPIWGIGVTTPHIYRIVAVAHTPTHSNGLIHLALMGLIGETHGYVCGCDVVHVGVVLCFRSLCFEHKAQQLQSLDPSQHPVSPHILIALYA